MPADHSNLNQMWTKETPVRAAGEEDMLKARVSNPNGLELMQTNEDTNSSPSRRCTMTTLLRVALSRASSVMGLSSEWLTSTPDNSHWREGGGLAWLSQVHRVWADTSWQWEDVRISGATEDSKWQIFIYFIFSGMAPSDFFVGLFMIDRPSKFDVAEWNMLELLNFPPQKIAKGATMLFSGIASGDFSFFFLWVYSS